jgi:hypothetical protein
MPLNVKIDKLLHGILPAASNGFASATINVRLTSNGTIKRPSVTVSGSIFTTCRSTCNVRADARTLNDPRSCNSVARDRARHRTTVEVGVRHRIRGEILLFSTDQKAGSQHVLRGNPGIKRNFMSVSLPSSTTKVLLTASIVAALRSGLHRLRCHHQVAAHRRR